MGKYVIKRILILIPIMLAVSFIVFSILYFTPADPARIMLGASAPPEALEQLPGGTGAERTVSGPVWELHAGDPAWRLRKFLPQRPAGL